MLIREAVEYIHAKMHQILNLETNGNYHLNIHACLSFVDAHFKEDCSAHSFAIFRAYAKILMEQASKIDNPQIVSQVFKEFEAHLIRLINANTNGITYRFK